MKLDTVPVFCLVALVLTACTTNATVTSTATTVRSSPPRSETSTPALRATTTGEPSILYFSIPSSAGEPPSDIIDHIVYYGVGGGEQNCPCLVLEGEDVSLLEFNPGVKYRVAIYSMDRRGSGRVEGFYITDWEITIPSSGSVELKIAGYHEDAYGLVLYDMNGRFVEGNTFDPAEEEFARLTEQAAPCGTYPTQLAIGGLASVSFNPPTANNVRQRWGTDSPRVGQIQPGEMMIITGGPECANGWIWWEIRSLLTDLVGWTSEGDGTDYWLIPE